MQEENTFSYIDMYCERVSNGSEPFNVVTNLAFVIASILLFKRILNKGNFKKENFDIIFLTFNLMVIGFGSAAFHYHPDGLTLNLDVIPIAIFIHTFLLSLLFRIFKLSIVKAILFFVAFVGAGVLSDTYLDRDILNGTIMYIPTYLTLLLIGYVLRSQRRLEARTIFSIAVIWTFSLTFRTIDISFCEYSFGYGTHLFWHIFNGVVLYKLVLLLIQDLERKELKKHTNLVEE